MKAIQTHYLGPTDYRGSRIVARAEGGNRVVVPYPYELSGEAVYRVAAEALRDKLGWTGELVGGGLPDGGYAFVFAPGGPTCKACGAPMMVTVRGHHHAENGRDVTL